MPVYYINKNQTFNGYNEVHTSDCKEGPAEANREKIGWHISGMDAVNYAKRNGYPMADGCFWCCRNARKGYGCR